MHGMLALHLGMRVRLLDALDEEKTLVKDAEGVVVRVEPHPADKQLLEEALRTGAGIVYLTKFPSGVWVRMDKYGGAPFTQILQEHCSTLLPADTQGLVFVEPRTSDPFVFREFKVTRTGLPLSHARVITSTACQGRTMRDGVIIDCGRQEGGNHPKDDEDWWLDLYVMLSRATRLDDLLLSRAPDLAFFAKGPPEDLADPAGQNCGANGHLQEASREGSTGAWSRRVPPSGVRRMTAVSVHPSEGLRLFKGLSCGEALDGNG